MHHADLHLHTTASDGAWSASEVLRVAAARGVSLLAITDHDETRSTAEARHWAQHLGITYVAGIEISTVWRGVDLHLVGLNIDTDHSAITSVVSDAKRMREARGRAMGEALEREGINDVYASALKYSQSPENLSRTHFARVLVERGICSHTGEVFTRYMKPGKPGYVPTEWTAIESAISAIRASGGDAVLAHPARYDLQWVGGMPGLLADFCELGGSGIEVFCAAHTPAEWSVYAAYCRRFGLKASLGSDFHSPKESRLAIGDLPRLPGSLTPIWADWEIAHA